MVLHKIRSQNWGTAHIWCQCQVPAPAVWLAVGASSTQQGNKWKMIQTRNEWLVRPEMNYTNSMDKFVAISCSCDRLQSNLMTSRGFVRIYNIYLLQTYWVSINSGPSSLLHRYTDKYIKCWPQNLCRYLILLQNSNVDTGRIDFKKSLFKLILKYYFCKVVIFIANKRDAKMNAMV